MAGQAGRRTVDARAPMAAPAPPRIRLFASSAERRRNLRVIGSRSIGASDLYHALLAASWAQVIGLVTVIYLAINALFGLGYLLVGGVSNADPSSFQDHFFFSVHTFGTIGYGSMYPQSRGAELLMTAESLTSLFMNAMVTGLAFARFARPTARVTWSNVACIADREGVPSLIIRVANERLNHVVDATMRVAMIRGERTKEGEHVRRVIDLPLMRSTSPSFILTWVAVHPITKDSPLFGLTPARLLESESEIIVTLTGLDETLGQTIHARTSYLPDEVRYGRRFVDVIGGPSDGSDRRRVVDLTKFHDTLETPLSWELLGVQPGRESP
jgi:inward rectifier potassium channel